MASVTVPVEGMTCGGCVASVTRALERLDGVQSARVSLADGAAEVDYDPERVGADQLVQAVRDAGFEVPAGWTPPEA